MTTLNGIFANRLLDQSNSRNLSGMKLSTVFVAALVPFAALSLPATAEDAAVAALTAPSSPEPDNKIQKRALDAVVRVDGLRYRKCPRTSCTAVGQYPKGKRIKLECYTRDNTTPVNGDR